MRLLETGTSPCRRPTTRATLVSTSTKMDSNRIVMNTGDNKKIQVEHFFVDFASPGMFTTGQCSVAVPSWSGTWFAIAKIGGLSLSQFSWLGSSLDLTCSVISRIESVGSRHSSCPSSSRSRTFLPTLISRVFF